MSRNVDNYRALQAEPFPKLVVFCAACAERGSSVFRLLGSPEETDRFAELIDLGWSAAAGEADEERVAEVAEQVESEVLSDESDDPESQGFFATQAALLAVNTLAVYLNPSGDKAEMSGQTMETILSDFDLALSGESARTQTAGDPPTPAGLLQQLEQEAQNSVIETASSASGEELTRDFVERVRRSSYRVRDQIAEGVVEVASRRGWELNA